MKLFTQPILRFYSSIELMGNGNSHTVSVKNLGIGDTSNGVTITPSQAEFDYYSVQVTHADGTTFYTKFYCNSSYSQNRVGIEICEDYCNCVYTDGRADVIGCYNKA